MLNLAEEPSSSSDESIDESSSSSYVHERSRSLLSEPSPATPPTSESPPATSPPSEPSNTTSPPGSNAPPPPPPPPSPPPPPPSELQSELDWGPELKSSSPPPSKNTPPPSPTQTLSPPPPPFTPSPPPPPSPSPPHSPPPHSPPPSPPYSPPPNPVSSTSNLPSSPPQLPSPSPPASSVLPPPSPFPSPPPPALYEQLATPLTGTPLPPQNTSPQPITSDRVNPLSTSAISSNPPSAPETLGSSPTGQLAPPTPSTGHPSIFNSAIPNLSIPNGFKPPSVPSISTPAGPQIQSPTLTHSNADTPSVTSSNHSSNSSSRHVVIGATVTGLVIISMLVFVIFIKRKRKKGGQNFAANYHPAPSNIIVQSDGYYYVQHLQQNALVGRLDGLYNGRPLPSPSTEKNNGNGGPDSGVIGGSISCFNYEDLMEVTNGFSKQNVIGEGGFGCVYKGWLADGRAVAVKQLKAGSGQGEREFRAEVEIISRVHHRHLVSLVGYCIAERHRLLVYEFLPNNNLDHHLHGKGMPVLEWSKRLKIALGAARGLAYLHDDCNPKIIHRDIKSANILLDDSFEAQVADFGLAKLTNDNLSHVSTRVVGTIGYMAPEYASSGKLTDRSDVYSFGVVLLELVTGRKSIDSTQPLGDESLVEWARPLLIRALDTGDFKALIDPRLESRYVESEMVRMIEAAAACVRHSASKRPRMVKIVRALDSEGDIYDLTNGLRVGQSTTYDSAQYSVEIKRFRKMAFGSWESSNYDMFSGEFGENSSSGRSLQHRDSTEAEFPSSSDSESQLIDPLRKEYQSNRYKPR